MRKFIIITSIIGFIGFKVVSGMVANVMETNDNIFSTSITVSNNIR